MRGGFARPAAPSSNVFLEMQFAMERVMERQKELIEYRPTISKLTVVMSNNLQIPPVSSSTVPNRGRVAVPIRMVEFLRNHRHLNRTQCQDLFC